MFFEMRFGLGTLDLGERSLPFRLLVLVFVSHFISNVSLSAVTRFESTL